MAISVWIMQVSLFLSTRDKQVSLELYNEIIMSVETTVGHSFHVISDHLGVL